MLLLFESIFSFTLVGLFSFYFGRHGGIFIVILMSIFVAFTCLVLLYTVIYLSIDLNVLLYNWLWYDYLEFALGLLFDNITVFMLLIISIISLIVQIFTVDYMGHDPGQNRFYAYLVLFTTCMFVLVTANNIIQFFFGWEGVGLCSFLLISFWATRYAANNAALKAMIMNRIADVVFTLGIVLFIKTFTSVNFTLSNSLINFLENTYILIIVNLYTIIDALSFFLIIGCMGKSAQLGLHTWLPEAMEGPTPVSSLLHAATMVTAGIFLFLRSHNIFELTSSNLINIIAVVGGFTAIYSSILGFFQYDIKKIIAYSTCSQLGYMFFSCGLLNFSVAFFHLINHAFFKALLFLSAGAIIHNFNDEQDIRRMGYFYYIFPFFFFCFVVGSLSIMGFPFLTGFYSKDPLLEYVFTNYSYTSIYLYILGVTAAIFTASYSFRLILYVFFINLNYFYSLFYYLRLYFLVHPYTFNFFLYFPLIALVLPTIFFGYLLSDTFIGIGSFVFSDLFLNSSFSLNFLFIEYMAPLLKFLPILLSMTVCITLAIYYLYLFYINVTSLFIHLNNNIFNIFYFGLFFNYLYDYMFYKLDHIYYYVYTNILDKGYLDLFGPFGIYLTSRYLSLRVIYNTFNILFINFFRIFVYCIVFVIYFIFFNLYTSFYLFSVFYFLTTYVLR